MIEPFMPRRRIRKLPPVGDPARDILISSLGKHSLKLIRGAVREAARGKLMRLDAMKNAADRIMTERDVAFRKRITVEFTPAEKAEVASVVTKAVRAQPSLSELKKWNITLLEEVHNPKSLFGARLNETDFKEMSQVYRPGFITFMKQNDAIMNKIHSTTGWAIILQQEFRAKGMKVPLQAIYDKLSQHDLSREKILSDEERSKTMSGVEQEIIHDMRTQRKEKMLSRTRSNQEISTLRRKMGRFEITREERKKLLNETRDRISTNATGVIDWALERGFKRARLAMRDRLARLELNPNDVFSSLGIDREGALGMKRLKILTVVLRGKSTAQEQKDAIARMVQKYANARQSNNPLSVTSFNRTFNEINPRKEEERRRRAERKKIVEAPKKPTGSPPKKIFPTTAGGFASLFGKEKRVTDEMAVALNKFLHGVRSRQYPDAQIDQLMEHQILTIIATQFQKSGRVSERALRELTAPSLLFEHFKRALHSLMKKGYLEYEFHAGSSDFVSITNASASKVLGKYNTKIARLHENGG